MLCEDYNFKVNVKELIFDYLDIWEREKNVQVLMLFLNTKIFSLMIHFECFLDV